jgi:lactose/L-arabinose transport system ATP-binding protein
VALKARPDTQLTVACAIPPKVGDAVTVGVRPEHFLPDGSGDTQMMAQVDVVEHLGNTSYVYAHTVPGEQIIIEQEERRHGGRYGDEIAVGISAKTSFLFDVSARRIR